ncbi:MAG: substrate-binding domain-containing protein [Lachnospiraceae bacterium]|nr:substrate-binding domain-containing protein [Lachnospiraceae bacterium]
MKRRVLVAVLSFTLAVGMLAGCSSDTGESSATSEAAEDETAESASEETDSSEQHYTFGFTEWGSASFFDAVYEPLEEVILANGDTVIHSEGQADSTYQMSVIEDFIAQDVDLVFYNPVDADASQTALEALQEAGIPVVNFDSQVSDLSLIATFVGTDNYMAGQLAGEQLVADFPDGGEIAVLDYPANTAAVDRADGFLDAIEDHGFTVVAQLDGQGSTETALSQAEDILQAHPDLIAFFGINDDSALGAYAAVTAAGEDVAIYGVNGSPEGKKKVAEGGIFKATAAQSVYNMGRESAEVAYKILAGEDYETNISITPILINADNVDEYLDSDWQ